jgi:hypothetical protein
MQLTSDPEIKNPSLPLVPSELIDVAVHDLELCAADPRYEINMMNWHEPFGDRCLVCLAGAFMAQTLHTPIHREVTPENIPDQGVRTRLFALDKLRCGLLHSFLIDMAYATDPNPSDPRKFRDKLPDSELRALQLCHPGPCVGRHCVGASMEWLRKVSSTLKEHGL